MKRLKKEPNEDYSIGYKLREIEMLVQNTIPLEKSLVPTPRLVERSKAIGVIRANFRVLK